MKALILTTFILFFLSICGEAKSKISKKKKKEAKEKYYAKIANRF